jgi:Fe-S-cluster formation regulator IscX/YfhJ
MDGSIYDLLMGHETGHALYTPAEGWHDAVTANSHAKFKPTLNIVEDARIEKLQKNKYPGLRRSFYLAYSELMRRDFFGVNSRPEIIEHLNLVDRVNLHFKVGSMLGIKFTAEEKKLVDRIEKITEWDDAVTISQELFDYVKDNEQDKINSVDELKQLIENLEDFLDEDGEVGDEQPFPMDSEESNEEDDGDTEEGDDASSNGSDAQDDQDDQEQEDKDPPTSEEISDKIKEILEKMHKEAGAADEEGHVQPGVHEGEDD